MSVPEYQGQFYISAEGISRDVITTDICRYLGNNARVRPNTDANGKIIGYWYCAYRALTDEMVRSLQEDSARWQREKDRNFKQGLSGTYEHSNSRTYHQDVPIQTPMQVPTSIPMQSHPSQMAPQMIPAHEKSDSERYVYDSQGNPYYDLKYKVYLNQPPPAARSEETPRVYTTESPAVLAHPASVPTGYWAVDPASGKQYYVAHGRAQWTP
ncbi:hypothetical protein EV426DRAFT_211810 [Tirmania nivea]|nr:hypothetical protein EV426DRAFT_211810 [Tirmania nivea]